MSCKSALYMANTSTQTVVVGGQINFGSIIRRFGQNISGSGSVINLNGMGYYDVDTNINILATAAGTVTITLYKDGVAIPGATASVIVASGEEVQVSIPCLVREKCCCESSITAIVSGIGTDIANASIVVSKI